jgi:hypothetical protein
MRRTHIIFVVSHGERSPPKAERLGDGEAKQRSSGRQRNRMLRKKSQGNRKRLRQGRSRSDRESDDLKLGSSEVVVDY